jgi:hypothetical protein
VAAAHDAQNKLEIELPGFFFFQDFWHGHLPNGLVN